MSLETNCPPHVAVLDDRGRLVCTQCERAIERPCLACVVERDGWGARHICSDDFTRDELVIGPSILVLLVLVALLVAGVTGGS